MARDIIDRIQEDQEEQESTLVTLTDIGGMVGMLPFYAGLFQMFSPDETTKLNGIVVFVISVIVVAGSWYIPSIAAALRVPGKKYIKNYVFYGSRMVPRDMEILHDPLVIAKLVTDDDGEDHLLTLDRQDEEYEDVMRRLGNTWLTDTEVEDKIEQALKDRYARIKKEREEKWSWLRIPDLGIGRRYSEWRAKRTEDRQ